MFRTDSYDCNIQNQLTNKIVCNTYKLVSSTGELVSLIIIKIAMNNLRITDNRWFPLT